ncbi:hypothetical protein BKA83DRAFT_4129364 [Pisolithus microcarpus]|nr:hypothetical protein BKA83DRAFT_4129364 [Pisolithus microcarpus]
MSRRTPRKSFDQGLIPVSFEFLVRVSRFTEARGRNDRIQEQPRDVVQNTTDITEMVKVTQAAVDKIAREAVESARAARCCRQWKVNAIREVESQRQEVAEIGVIETTVDIPTRTLIRIFCPVRRLLHPDGHRDLDELYEVPNPYTYLRSKADVHICNIAYKEGYNSDRDDVTTSSARLALIVVESSPKTMTTQFREPMGMMLQNQLVTRAHALIVLLMTDAYDWRKHPRNIGIAAKGYSSRCDCGNTTSHAKSLEARLARMIQRRASFSELVIGELSLAPRIQRVHAYDEVPYGNRC